ncbi:hypothetical protein C8J56DRAFT_1027357 [Mycena floridula]|nr:hypothetical protein C8J56DRAFT_1027357 [Mycena floridula]
MTTVFVPMTLVLSFIWSFIGSFFSGGWSLRLFTLIPLLLGLASGGNLGDLPNDIHHASTTLSSIVRILTGTPLILLLSPSLLLLSFIASMPFIILIFQWRFPYFALGVWLWTWAVMRGVLSVWVSRAIKMWYKGHPVSMDLPKETFGSITLGALVLSVTRIARLFGGGCYGADVEKALWALNKGQGGSEGAGDEGDADRRAQVALGFDPSFTAESILIADSRQPQLPSHRDSRQHGQHSKLTRGDQSRRGDTSIRKEPLPPPQDRKSRGPAPSHPSFSQIPSSSQIPSRVDPYGPRMDLYDARDPSQASHHLPRESSYPKDSREQRASMEAPRDIRPYDTADDIDPFDVEPVPGMEMYPANLATRVTTLILRGLRGRFLHRRRESFRGAAIPLVVNYGILELLEVPDIREPGVEIWEVNERWEETCETVEQEGEKTGTAPKKRICSSGAAMTAQAPPHIQNILENNTFENIHGGFLLNNTVNTYNAPIAAIPGRARGYMPAPNDRLFGRDEDVKEIVRILVRNPSSSHPKRARFALLGAGGQGKTALALEVMAQLAMKQCYSGKNGVWIPCEEATSAELLLNVIYTSLDITQDSHNTIQDILTELGQSSDPILLLLDNFETPWNAPWQRGAVACIIRDIAQFPHVALFVTMRAAAAPCEEITWEEKRIQALDPKASLQLFTAIYQKAQGESKLGELLEMLGHMALAVKLMARHGKNTGYTVEQLISSYKVTGTAMLGRNKGSDPQNSVSVSICVSLESSLVKDELNAHWLLNIIAMLPSGTTIDGLQQYWAPNLQNLDGALEPLLEASLLECQSTTYFVLPVIRSYLLDSSRLPNDVHDSMVAAACNFLQQYQAIDPGQPSFIDDMKVRANEEANLQAILLNTSESNSEVIESLRILAWHQYRVRPCLEVIEHAVKLVSKLADQYLIGQVRKLYAAILKAINHFDDCLQQHKLARDAFLAASEPALAAWTLLNIADASVLIDSAFDEIPLIEQAQQEFESIYSPQPTHPHRILHPFLRLRDHFKKSAAITPKHQAIPDKYMVNCLWRLGQAHSRSDNHSEAVKHLREARDLSAAGSFHGANCAEELARAYSCLGQFDEAEKWGVVAVRERREMGGDLVYVLWILGMIYISKGEYNKAVNCLQEGMDSAKAQGDLQWTADFWLELGRAQMKKGNCDDAQASFMEALGHYRDLQGVAKVMLVCQFYLDKLEDPSRVPTSEERKALDATDHEEDLL